MLSGENKSLVRKLAAGSGERLSAQEEAALLKKWRKINAVGKLHALAHFVWKSP